MKIDKYACCLAILLMAFFFSAQAQAATYTVSNTNDSGAGSLRQAIIDSNTAGGSNTIDFTAPTGTITLLTDLNTITNTVTFTSTTSSTITLEGKNMGSNKVLSLSSNCTMTVGSGSGVSVSNEVNIGKSGTAILNINNGGTVSDTIGYIANPVGTTGTVNVDGAGSSWTNSSFISVGLNGTAYLNITNGGTVNSTIGYVGFDTNSTGTATIDGTNSTWTCSSAFYIGNNGILAYGQYGNGTLNVENGGTVNVAGGAATMYMYSDATHQATINIGGGAGTTNGIINALSITGPTATMGIVNFNHDNALPYTFAIPLGGNLRIDQKGPGTTVLTGANTYAGTTTITAGTLQIGGGGTIGTLGSGAVTNNSALKFNRTDAITVSNVISGTGTLEQTGSGTLTLTGNNTYTGITTLSGGTVNLGIAENAGTSGPLGKSAAANPGSIVLSGGTLQYSASNANDYSGRFSTAAGQQYNVDTNGRDVIWATALTSVGGALTKSGSGALTLSNTNTYTGATTISAGTVNFSQSLTTSALNFSGDGTAVFADGANVTSAITNDIQNQGTVTFSDGTHDVGGAIGSTGTGVKLVQVGLSGGITGTTFNGDVKATSFAFTGNGGNVSVAAGKSITLQDAALTVNTNGATTINYLGSTTISNNLGTSAMRFAYINFNGGTASLGANIYTDPASQGGLGKTTIDNATLSPTGDRTVGGALKLQNAAVVDVGLNALTVTGIYTQSSGTTLKLTVNSKSDYGTITSAGGSVAGTITPTVTGYLPNNATLDIITSTTGSLTYDAATSLTPYSRYTFTGSEVGGVLTLTVNRTAGGFASAALNPNQVNVGNVLDNVTNPTADMTTVLNALDALSGSAVAQALNTMEPDTSAAILQVCQATLDQLTQAILGHQQYLRSSPTGVSTGSDMLKGLDVWAQGYGSYLHQDPRQLSQGYNASVWGTAVGFDIPSYTDIRVGTCFGFAQDYIRGKDNSNRTDANAYQWTVYGEYSKDALYVDLSGAFALNTYDGSRSVSVGPGINRIASSDYNGYQYQLYVEAGYTFNCKSFGFDKVTVSKIGTQDPSFSLTQLNITPLVSFQYQHLTLDKYTEDNAGALNLTVKSQNYDLAQTGLGLKLDYPIDTKYGTLLPELRVKWLYDWVGDKQANTSSFTGGGASFATNGFTPAQSAWDFGTKITMFTKNNWTMSANYDFEVKEDYYGHYGYANLKYSF